MSLRPGTRPSHRAVSVYVLDALNRVLLLKHKKLGVWLPPGGHVEHEEYTHEAARREVREEAGVSIVFLSLFPLSERIDERSVAFPAPLFVQLEDLGDHDHEDFIYLARSRSAEIGNPEEHEIHWFSFDEARALETFPNCQRQLRHIEDLIQRAPLMELC